MAKEQHIEPAPEMPTDEKVGGEELQADFMGGNKEAAYVTRPKPESIANMTDEELRALDKKMVRKMDAVILPIVGLLYILNYVDRSGLAATHVYGIVEDLGMKESDFNTAIAILFATYIPAQIPSNLLVSRIPRPGMYICCMATIWGAVSAATGAVKNRNELWAVRILLGIAEAAYFPGALYFLSAWYTRPELAKRIAALYMFQALGQALGGFLAAGCLNLDGAHGIAGWRWLFIVEGVITVGVGIISMCIMPEFPHNARLLKPIERDYAVWRLEAEAGAGEAHEQTSTATSFKLAMMDKKVWMMVWCGGLGQCMGSVFNFFPSIIQSLGYDKIDSLLLTVPPYIVAMIGYYACSFISDRYNQIYWIIAGSCMAAVPVYILSMFAPNTGSRYFAMCLLPVVGVSPQVMVYKTLSLHMARPYTKRAAGLAMVNSIGGISNIWTSYLWFGGPHYYAAFGTLMGAAVVWLASITFYRFWVRNLNKKLDGTPGQIRAVQEKHNVTQEQVDMGWRYTGY